MAHSNRRPTASTECGGRTVGRTEGLIQIRDNSCTKRLVVSKQLFLLRPIRPIDSYLSPQSQPWRRSRVGFEPRAHLRERSAIHVGAVRRHAIARDDQLEAPHVSVVGGEQHANVCRDARENERVDLQVIEQHFERGGGPAAACRERAQGRVEIAQGRGSCHSGLVAGTHETRANG